MESAGVGTRTSKTCSPKREAEAAEVNSGYGYECDCVGTGVVAEAEAEEGAASGAVVVGCTNLVGSLGRRKHFRFRWCMM